MPSKKSPRKPVKKQSQPMRLEDSYTPTEASKILGLSTKRIRQLVEEGKLTAVQRDPLKVSAVEVLAERDKRAKEGKPRESLPTSSLIKLTPEQYAEVLAHARQSGIAEAQLLLEVVSNEQRLRAERAEQRLAETEAKLLEIAGTNGALLEQLRQLEQPKGWRKLFK
jgi:DNA-binding transcriptional MerR regulator